MFEIPTVDFQRALDFYQSILDIRMEVINMEGIEMGMFPNAGSGISGAIIHGADYKPSPDGVVIYLNGGPDLNHILGKVESGHGKVIVPKTQISPDMGYYAIFIDTEGNKLGLHSMS